MIRLAFNISWTTARPHDAADGLQLACVVVVCLTVGSFLCGGINYHVPAHHGEDPTDPLAHTQRSGSPQTSSYNIELEAIPYNRLGLTRSKEDDKKYYSFLGFHKPSFFGRQFIPSC